MDPTLENVDLYELLKIPPDADDRQIKRAYRRLALKYHPDKGGGKDAEVLFHKIASATEILSSAELRQQYDRKWKSRQEQVKKRHEKSVHRKRFRDDLERRERAAASAATSSRSSIHVETLDSERKKRKQVSEQNTDPDAEDSRHVKGQKDTPATFKEYESSTLDRLAQLAAKRKSSLPTKSNDSN